MRNEKLVSIIVPIYNVEKYIKHCVESIMAQTYKNIEIILIDDGSQDLSGEILESMKSLDQRIIVVHKQNEGVSAARNDGIDIANGEYFVFVDGDDWIDERFIEAFVNTIEELDTEIVISYKNLIDDEPANYELAKKGIITSSMAIEQLYLGKIGVAVWNKIYKKNFIKSNGLKFKTQYWFAEGMTFNIECFMKCSSVGVCSLDGYHQVTNLESAVRKFNLASYHCGLSAMEFQRTILNTNDSNVMLAWRYHYREYNVSILYGLLSTGQSDFNREEVFRCANNLHHNFFSVLRVDIGIKTKMREMLISIMPLTAIKLMVIKKIGHLPIICNDIVFNIVNRIFEITNKFSVIKDDTGDIEVRFVHQFEIRIKIKKDLVNRKMRKNKNYLKKDSIDWGGQSIISNGNILLCNIMYDYVVNAIDSCYDIILSQEKERCFATVNSKEGYKFLKTLNNQILMCENDLLPRKFEIMLQISDS